MNRIEMVPDDDDDDMEFERELEVDYIAQRVVAVPRANGEGPYPNIEDPIQPFVRGEELRPDLRAPAAMTDAQMTQCMWPITLPGKFNDANPCTITITAPTLHLAARAVIDILQHGNSSLPEAPFEGPPGVTVSDIRLCEPIGFLDIRTSYEVFVLQHLLQIGN